MNDKQMAALFMAQVLPAMQATAGLETVKLARNFQSRQQGANSAAYCYFFKIGDHRHGSPQRQERYDTQAAAFVHTEIQQYETTYQFSAWVPQDPANTTELTESDILNAVSSIMQSEAILSAFQAQEVGILRVTDVRNPYIVDDRDRFEAVPTFDVVLTHKRQRVTTLPAVVAYDLNLSRV
jgi:hypothetical protein